jgi:multiple sugar transport system ATP-binding protein
LTLGIRPEHVVIHPQPKAGTLAGTLYVTQMLGSEILYLIRVDEQLVSVRVVMDDAPAIPEQVWLEFRPERIFFYDADGNLHA